MISVRCIAESELSWFCALDGGEPAPLEATLRDIWASGAGRPEWTLVAEGSHGPIGRLALFTEELGCGLDVMEGKVAAPWLKWSDPEHEAAAHGLFDAAVASAAAGAPTTLERRLNPEVHTDIPRWRTILEACGFSLFQEKAGFVWTDDGGPLPEPSRLRFRSLAEVGANAYARAMAAAIPGTLDRNDRYYLERCGPAAWGREMIGALEPGGESSWLLAEELDGTPAGYVAVDAFEPDTGTIVHIAVVPERRGRGYVDDLLRAANLAARERGHRSMLSDVDTLNLPMLAAMERNGHRRGVRPWHVWHYRRAIE